MTHQYELMVILDPEIDERTVAPSLDKFLNVIRNDGGTIDNVDIWGRRRLAYEIKKKTEGIYAVVNFTATSDATVELDRQLKLSEAVCAPRCCAPRRPSPGSPRPTPPTRRPPARPPPRRLAAKPRRRLPKAAAEGRDEAPPKRARPRPTPRTPE